MSFNCYETRDIISWVNLSEVVPNFFLNTFFSDQRVSTADKIVLGNYTRGVKMAPFSNRCAPGKPVQRIINSRNAIEAVAPMIHLSDTVTECTSEEFRIGDQGQFINNFADRMQAAVAREAADQRDSILKRVAHMCAMLVINGQYVIEGEDVERTIMDFGRNVANTIDLTLGAPALTWDQTTARIFTNLQAWSRLLAGNGQITVMMAPDVADAAMLHEDFADWIKPSWSRLAQPAKTAEFAGPTQFQFATNWAENQSFDFWTVEESYIDPITSAETRYIPDGHISLVRRPAFGGLRMYQAINRPDGSQDRGTIFPRDYVDPSCDCRKIGSKSRPMPLARNINASATIRVM